MNLKRITLFTLAALIIGTTACAVATKRAAPLPRFSYTRSNTPKIYGPIVRLETKDHHFFCSGFVADDHYVVTAAHCLGGSKSMLINGITPAKRVGGSGREDFGLVIGDFRAYQNAKIDFTSAMSLELSNRIVNACGYPEGIHKVVCTPARILGPSFFYHVAIGELYPGMSGGPVYDMRTNTVIGINSQVSPMDAANPHFVYFARTTGILGAFEIEPKGM